MFKANGSQSTIEVLPLKNIFISGSYSVSKSWHWLVKQSVTLGSEALCYCVVYWLPPYLMNARVHLSTWQWQSFQRCGNCWMARNKILVYSSMFLINSPMCVLVCVLNYAKITELDLLTTRGDKKCLKRKCKETFHSIKWIHYFHTDSLLKKIYQPSSSWIACTWTCCTAGRNDSHAINGFVYISVLYY